MKRLVYLLCSILLTVLTSITAMPVSALGTNLVPNPSLEQNSSGMPTSWGTDQWGTNTATFSYSNTGSHTGTYSVTTTMSSYNSGDAKWYFNAVSVAPNTSYTISDWYKSTVQSNVDLEVTTTSGSLEYYGLDTPASSGNTWKQASYAFTTPSNATKLTVLHSLSAVGRLTTDDYSVATTAGTPTPTPTPTAPTVSLTAPAAASTVNGSVALNANASDAQAVTSVQFKVDGANVGAADTTAPYSVSWDSTKAADGSHTVTAVATNSAGLTTTSAPVNVTVKNTITPTTPTVSITAPSNNGTVSSSTVVTANVTDTTPIAGVQFKLDGSALGAEDTSAPYSFVWDTTTATNGNHTLTAVARNTSGGTATSTAVTVTVDNAVTPPPAAPNLISNPSFETASSATAPADWQASNWGTNTSTFSYLNTGHTGGHSVKVQTTSYTDGAANWYYNEVPVKANQAYLYTNWYQSNVDTEVDAEVTLNDGSIQYYWLGTVPASTSWAQYKATFNAPSGATSMAIYQILGKVGYIVSDDYSMSEYTPVPFNRALVSVTFDDGWANQYKNAYPVLQQLGINGTFYIISGELHDTPDYMTGTQVKNLYASGNEIGSHTVTHPDLTTLSATQDTNQMANSQATLQNLIGAPVTDFAYPYGAYNTTTINIGKKYYASQRSVNGGLNTHDNLDVTQLKIHEVDSNISQAQVKAWIDEAAASHAWLILVYHEVATTPSAPDDSLYTTQPSDFSAEMHYLKGTGVTVETVKQALAEVTAQP